MVGREYLDSDRVNFLIWRYLLEGNYRETAAKFQKEWHINEPHRDLPFARHVKGHALVSVINRGLIYHALEREYARNQMSEHVAAEAQILRMGVFGPLEMQQPAKMEEDEDEDEDAEGEEVESTRKRAPIQVPNGSPAKRPRLSNGYDLEGDAATVSTPMEIDHPTNNHNHNHSHSHSLNLTLNHNQNHNTNTTSQNGTDHADNHAYPSPTEGEQISTPLPQTEGPEQGTQFDEVQDLSSKTTFIRLLDYAGKSETANSPSTTADTAGSAENAPILLQCEWNPKDPSMLAAAGTDALARIWTVTHINETPATGPSYENIQSRGLLGSNMSKLTTVAALAWTSDGASIAVASDSGASAVINLWSANGTHLQTMEVAEAPVVKLAWNPSNTALLVISPEKRNGGALIAVYYLPAGDCCSYSIPDYDINSAQLDACWTGDTEFLLCGVDLLLCLACSEDSISVVRKVETKEDDTFTMVLYDWRSRLAATSSDKGVLDLWDEAGRRRTIVAHQAAITTMAWQPCQDPDASKDDERLIATGAEDCAIVIWNARTAERKQRCFMTMNAPIVRLAFTPDGTHLAGATSSQILIWKVDHSAVPVATWTRQAHPSWLSPRASLESDDEDEHCLCWDSKGEKLAYGSNSRLAIFQFQR